MRDGFRREPLLHQPRRVVGDAIGALVELRDHYQHDLQVALRQDCLVREIQQQALDVLQHRRTVGEHFHLIQERAVLAGEALVYGLHVLRNLVDLDVAYTCHLKVCLSLMPPVPVVEQSIWALRARLRYLSTSTDKMGSGAGTGRP